MPALALFGITNEGLNLVVNLLVLFLVVIWIALVVYTYMDARRRLDDSVLVTTATVASLFPFVGTVVYTILRPPEFLDDKQERELEMQAARLRVRQLEESSCPNCSHPIERTYLRCPSCRARVKDPCESCAKPIDPRWSVCPYCETPVRRAQPQQRSQRRADAPRPPRQKRTTSSQAPASAASTGGGTRSASGSSSRGGGSGGRSASRKRSSGGRPASEVKAPKRSPSKPARAAKPQATESENDQPAGASKRTTAGLPTQETPAVPQPDSSE